MLKVLGIDIASADWSSNGSAVITFDPSSQTFKSVQPAAIPWPTLTLSAKNLANAIDDYARGNGISAVALDGPQGWRDPSTPQGTPGVGRRCEYECRTQAKTGVYPLTFPGNQRPWIEFCIDVFAELLGKERILLADSSAPRSALPDGGYVLLECNPTSAWCTSGLAPLPGKSKRPRLEPYLVSLAATYGLPPIAPSVRSHDDVQAVVAALVAAAVVGGPALPISTGIASTIATDEHGIRRRVEGFIWNVRPLSATASRQPSAGLTKKRDVPAAKATSGMVRVTQRVVDQIGRVGVHQSQIALRNVAGGTKTAPATVVLGVNDEEYTLVVGDSHAAWRSHQSPTTLDSFDRLFAVLADRPDVWQPIAHFGVNRREGTPGLIARPTTKATYERARRLANLAIWSIQLQCRRLESSEPEDTGFVLRRWADFDFLIVALIRLRRAANLAAELPELQSSLRGAVERFDNALPRLKEIRDVAEHIDDYALEKGRNKSVVRQALEVSTLDAQGPTLEWLGARLNAGEALQASQDLFAAVQSASRLFKMGE